MKPVPRIVHLTSVHRYFDPRIVARECQSLANEGFDVHLVAAGAPDTKIGDVSIHGVPKTVTRRIHRATVTGFRIYRLALSLKAAVYHLHDPELLWVGLLLRIRGKAVIYDAHENLPQTFLTKPYLSRPLRRPLSWLVTRMENFFVHFMTGIVAATPGIAYRFDQRKTTLLQNFPLRSDVTSNSERPYKDRPPLMMYAGGISEQRGLLEVLDALVLVNQMLPVKAVFMGAFFEPHRASFFESRSGWKYVDFLGWQDHGQMLATLGSGRVAICTFHPVPNHVDAQPNKLFEYMVCGLPVIASNFPLWKELIDNVGCGIVVDPQDSKDIAKAILWILEHPEEAAQMGIRARKAILERYNWDQEKEKLIKLYQTLTPTSFA